MTGTDMHSVESAWMDLAVDEYITPTLGGHYTAIPVTTPEEFWPFGGVWDETIDDSIAEGISVIGIAVTDALAGTAGSGDARAQVVVFGYSQSAIIAALFKQRLAEATQAGQPSPAVTFVLIGNPTRPNGGLNARFPGLRLPGWTFYGPAPTDSGFVTIDVARQYDPFADFPQYPLNLFALANAFAGLFYAHDYTKVTLDPADPGYNPATEVQHFGDTTYYLIPAEHLPLLQPLWDLGFPAALLDRIEPPLRTLVEAGYDRTIPFGQPAPARLSPIRVPLTTGSVGRIPRGGGFDRSSATPVARERRTISRH